MAAQETHDDDDLISGINITPLVDVVLVLLVVLMVTASFVVARTLPLDLPKASSGEAVPTTLAISLDVKGQTYLDGRALSEAELRLRLRESRRGDPDARAIVAADGSVPHRSVVHLLDVLRQEGIVKFAIHISPEERAEP